MWWMFERGLTPKYLVTVWLILAGALLSVLKNDIEMQVFDPVSLVTRRDTYHNRHNLSGVNIETIINRSRNLTSRWNNLFDCIFSDQILSIHNNHSIMLTKQSESCMKSLKINMTSLMLQTYSLLSPNPLIFSFHHTLQLRRQIMIIYKLLNLDVKKNVSIYYQLMHVFVTIYNYHNEHRIFDENFKLYHIHVSKAAGRTVKWRLRSLSNLFNKDKLNIPKESELSYIRPNVECSKQYKYCNKTYVFVREGPVLTYTDEKNIVINDYYNDNDINININITIDINQYKPSICRKFIYLLPFREPLERLFSQSSQFNNLFPFALQGILRKVSSINNIATKNVHVNKNEMNIFFRLYNKYCTSSENILINGEKYQVLSKSEYFKSFYKFLYETELEYLEKHDNSLVMETMRIQHKLWQFKIPFCYRNYGKEKDFSVFAINQTVKDLNESKFLWVVSNSRLYQSIAWLRTKALSNTYTTWLGYYPNNKYIKPKSYISSSMPNYIYRKFIDKTHLKNAIDFILKIDYVMPFSTKKYQTNVNKDNTIWNITLYNVFNFLSSKHSKHVHSKNSKHSKHSKHSTHMNSIFNIENDYLSYYYPYNEKHYKNVEWTHRGQSSKEFKLHAGWIEKALSKNEIDLLIKLNQLDITLYKIAKLIQQVDVYFYQNFVV